MGKTGKIVEVGLTRDKAVKLVREVCRDSSHVFFTQHAEKRMKERHLTRPQIFRCLEHGRLVEGPVRSIKGNWEMKFEALSAGDLVTAVAALERDETGNGIIVITVF